MDSKLRCVFDFPEDSHHQNNLSASTMSVADGSKFVDSSATISPKVCSYCVRMGGDICTLLQIENAMFTH